MNADYEALESSLEELRRICGTRDFREQGKAFQLRLKDAQNLTRAERDYLWNEQQKLWDISKKESEKRQENSKNSKWLYLKELGSIEFSHDGAAIMQTFSDWERVGDKVRYARQQIKNIQQRLKEDSSLVKADREDVRHKIDSIWDSINQTEDTTFFVHREKAHELYNESSMAVKTLSPRDARAVLKAANAEVRTLYLKSSDRDKLRSWFDDLWQDLNARYEEANAAWRSRQEAGLSKLLDSRSRLYDSLEKVRGNISSNWSRYYDAKSSDFQDVVRDWISEGEEREREIEQWIGELDEKISDCESRLR